MSPQGVRFYSALIDELIKHGIHPVPTATAAALSALASNPRLPRRAHGRWPRSTTGTFRCRCRWRRMGGSATTLPTPSYARTCFERCVCVWKRGRSKEPCKEAPPPPPPPRLLAAASRALPSRHACPRRRARRFGDRVKHWITLNEPQLV